MRQYTTLSQISAQILQVFPNRQTRKEWSFPHGPFQRSGHRVCSWLELGTLHVIQQVGHSRRSAGIDFQRGGDTVVQRCVVALWRNPPLTPTLHPARIPHQSVFSTCTCTKLVPFFPGRMSFQEGLERVEPKTTQIPLARLRIPGVSGHPFTN